MRHLRDLGFYGISHQEAVRKLISKEIMPKLVRISGSFIATKPSDSPPTPLFRALAGLDREGSLEMSFMT